MNYKVIPILVVSGFAAQADVLTSTTQRFFGLGGQYPGYTDGSEETPASALDQAPYSPADSDLGVQEILVERGSREPVIFDFVTSILRTDSAPSRTGADRSSWVSASSISVAWRPHIAQGWFADFGIGQDILRYDRTDGLDFENLSTRLGVFKVLPDLDDTIIFARYEYQRITLNSLSDGNYNAQRLRAGLEKIVWSIPRQQVVVNLSGAYEWSAHPQSLERNEFSAEFAYSYSLTDSIYTVLSGKVYRFNYDQFGRDDWTYVLSTELIWQMNERCRASAVLLFDKNVSDTFGNFNEYEAWSGGLALGVELSF